MSQPLDPDFRPTTRHTVTSPGRVAPDPMTASDTSGSCRSVLGTYPDCPLCGGDLFPEHAHFRCSGCGWRDSCCD